MSDDWHNEQATEKQKEKLRFFGCTWDDGITTGQADDALEECAKQFPGAEADYQKSQPATEKQKEKLRFFGCNWNGDITVGKASEALGECERQFPDREAMWQFQKKKWSKVSLAIERAATIKTPTVETRLQYLERERTRRARSSLAKFLPTPEQIAEIRSFGKIPPVGLTFQEAEIWIEQCKVLNPPKPQETPADDEKVTLPAGHWFPAEPKPSDPKYQAWMNPAGQEYGFALDHLRWKESVKQIKAQIEAEKVSKERKEAEEKQNKFSYDQSHAEAIKLQSEIPQEAEPEPPSYLDYLPEPQPDSFLGSDFENAHAIWFYDVKQTEAENRQRYDKYVTSLNHWNFQRNEGANKQPKPFPEPPKPQNLSPQEVTIQEAAKPQTTSPREIIPEPPKDFRQSYEMFCPACDGQIEVQSGTVGKKRACPNCQAEVTPVFFKKKSAKGFIPARVVPDYAQSRPEVRKQATYKIHTPIERLVESVDGFLERNQTCLGGHWLSVGPLNYVFTSDAISISLCRQLASVFESKGYCVEPDARFGSGTYDRNQTLALFKPLDGDPIQPSTAYLGAANLLRLCILITTADGKIDLVELDVFRRAIENQPGLTLTDHKRLLILEQLLAQELCSTSKTAAKIAKSIRADKRFVIGKLLVEVAAANNFITDGERRALDKIFKSFEISPEVLESLIAQICPSQWPLPDSVESDVSKNDRWLWNHWRTGHPGVVIDDTTLAGKRWNFNDWKALNARWRDLHERLAARQKYSSISPGIDSSEASPKTSHEQVPRNVSDLEKFLNAGRMLGRSSDPIQKPIPAPAPRDFALDMARVYEITSETKEVVAILSVLMEDEPEKSIAPAATITLPAPEIPKVSGEGNAAPQPTRFSGLDAAFHPILERLLARDSWPKNDFKSLADEFHFMPSKIHDTLNEWSDETLGDYILDGEDPVIVHGELIAKEKTYG